MTKSELEAWAANEFWIQYKRLLRVPFKTKWDGGAKGVAVAAIVKLKPSQATRDAILDAIDAQVRHRATLFKMLSEDREKYENETRYNKLYSNRNGSTWINAMGWLDEIPSLTVDKPKQVIDEDLTKNIQKQHDQVVLKSLSEKGIFNEGDSPQEVARKCREWCKKNVRRIVESKLPGG